VSIIQETCTDAYNDLDVTSVLPTRVGKLAPEACVNLAITRLPHACREADSLLREVSPTCTRKLVEE
jgi:hypothetical protein